MPPKMVAISIGDCALFKPPQDSPPFIGLIRWLTSRKDNNLHLGVNWLYRPAELKLGKGSLLDSAPNEIFYFISQGRDTCCLSTSSV
ncbi:hypothetical protein Sango_3116100 [Sesamum angolense]|uniref:BAH domain-containing protein n=1 Tax=Sesamum angolense TaxID=2727404 RepID=A0AAE1T949_9LAMI|nr:hypothetical protein Sango_3116100 [Sesamum angolense]